MTPPEVETLSSLEGPEQELAAARSRAYALFSEGLAYPNDELRESLIDGGLAQPLRECLTAISTEITNSPECWRALQEVGDTDDLAIEFTRLFDAGASGPPCPLYGGLYAGDRMAKMEEAVRFYNHFGLTLSDEQRELPDHITTELEFMHFLAYREVEALQAGVDPGSYRRAQRDFVARNLGSWIPKLCERLEKEGGAAYFQTLLGLLAELLKADGKHFSSV
ncbi:MAG: molecular chaperone TorD family protein [Deltaproteobacteria bacterium]|nr:molecular chaperone TorD family protein [Deltaproteobacteria bacterium]MBW2668182.1 molecular chaperone TorD family protein [Deltaproteobacteria bacterium]